MTTACPVPTAPSPGPLPPLVSPMPHSPGLDREEPAFVDEPDFPSPPTPAPQEQASDAGEEDPGAALDTVDPPRGDR